MDSWLEVISAWAMIIITAWGVVELIYQYAKKKNK